MSELMLVPHDEDVEMAALGSMMQYGTAQAARALHRIEPNMFYTRPAKTVASAIYHMADKQSYLDALLVHGRLKDAGLLDEIGGMRYLQDCMDKAIIPGVEAQYFTRIRDLHMRRAAITTCQSIVTDAMDTEEGEDFVMGLPQRFYDLIPQKHSEETMEDVHNDLIESFQKLHDGEMETMGLSTGIPELDKILGGLEGGNYYVIAARPSAGKTSLAGQIDENLLIQGHHTAWVNMDMPKRQLYARNQCRTAGVSYAKMRAGHMTRKDRAKLEQARDTWKGYNCHFLNAVTDVGKICAWVRLMKLEYNIQCLTIDFVGKCTASAVNSTEARRIMAYASATLKELCQDLELPLIMLAQLRRADKRDTRPPTFDELKECGNLEEDAQAALLLYKEDKFPYDLTGTNKRMGPIEEKTTRAIWLDVAKQQNGMVGRHEYFLHAPYFKMTPAGNLWGYKELFDA